MGDRANIYITNENGSGSDIGIYFYTHWSGHIWPEILRQALKFGEPRWGDDPYLVRILASRMFKGIEDDTIGGGISLSIGDNSYPVTVVDLATQEVAWSAPGDEISREKWYNVTSFADFAAKNTATYPS